MRMALPAPSSRTSPYMPDTTYATASPMVIRTPSSFWAPFLQAWHQHHMRYRLMCKHGQHLPRSLSTRAGKPAVALALSQAGTTLESSTLQACYRCPPLCSRTQSASTTAAAQPQQHTHSSSRSAFTLLSTSMSFEPASSCITRPAVTIGEMPNSMHVPRLLAMITRAQ
jgi:hypothetical protein